MNLNKSLAEFLGTYIFLFVIIYLGNPWAIGLALTIVILLFGKISGGNFNPAVTVMMVLAKKEPLSELIPYILAQLLGAFAAFKTFTLLK